MYLQMPMTDVELIEPQFLFGEYNMDIERHYLKEYYSDILDGFADMSYINLTWLYEKKKIAIINKLSNMDCNGGFKQRYGTIFHYELQEICNINYGDLRKNKINQAHVILVLAYIRCSMTFKEGFFVHGCYNHISNISEDIGLSDTIILKCIEYLEQLNILKAKKLKRFMHDGCWKTNYTVFTNAKDIYNDANYGDEEINKIIKYIEYRKEIVYSM